MNPISQTVESPGVHSAAVSENSAAQAVKPPEPAVLDAPVFNYVHLSTSFADQDAWRAHPSLHGFCVFYAGWYVEAKGHFWQRNNANEGIYIYCTGGRGFYRQDGKEWQIGAGDLLYCAPFTNHSYGADANEPWTIYWMHVSGPEIATYSSLLGCLNDRPVIHVGHRPRAIEVFQTTFQYLRAPLTAPRMAALGGAGRLALSLMAMNEETPAAAGNNIAVGIQRVLANMEEHVCEHGSVADWVKITGTSRSHFQREFKRITGQSPHGYFLRLKIQKACSLLSGSIMRIGKIGNRVGISDSLYFSRLFRKMTGYTARDYRRRAHQE